MKETLNIYTCCNKSYNNFIPLFVFSHLYHNPTAFIEIGYDDELSEETQKAISYISKIFPNRFLINKIEVGVIIHKKNKITCVPNLSRFIIEPTVKSKYIYISDIDIICLQKDLLSLHVKDMEKTGLPYSNIVRKVADENQQYRRLTGLHFSLWDNYYPLPPYADLIEKRLHNHDEVFLYELVKKRFSYFDYENEYRPVHGIHISLNREPIGKINWGITEWADEWVIFRNTSEFKEFEKYLGQFLIEKINTIDKYALI
ncbi:MAG: hypothetical protein RLZZ479_788 [Bacteroidota bacterium]